MKYKLLLLLCFFTVAFLTETEASARKKKKETAKTPVKKESAYDKLFKKDHTQAKGLINLHRVDNKLYFELPLQLLGKDMLLGSTVTEISDNGDAIVGQKPKEPLHIQFTMIDSTIQLRQIFNYSITRPEDKNIANAIEKANIGAIIGVYKVEAYNPDSTAVVFDITKLFVGDNKDLEPIDDYGANTYGGYLVRSSRFQQDKSFLGEIKAFEDNVLVRSHLSYECDIRGGQNYYEYKKPLTVVATRSIVLLPEIPVSRIREWEYSRPLKSNTRTPTTRLLMFFTPTVGDWNHRTRSPSKKDNSWNRKNRLFSTSTIISRICGKNTSTWQ